MAGREWVLDFGMQQPRQLSLNGARGNPRAHSGRVKAMRRHSWALALEAKIPHLQRVQIELHYVPTHRRRRDPFNLVGVLKPIEDGIVDAGVIPDDTPEHSEPTVPVIDEPSGKPGRVYVIVRELVDKTTQEAES